MWFPGEPREKRPCVDVITERGEGLGWEGRLSLQIAPEDRANAEFMRSLGIAARSADVPVGDELFKRDPQICKAMETGDEVMYMKAIAG